MEKYNIPFKRYRIYREHKFIVALVNDTGRKIATTDFSKNNEVKIIKKEITKLDNFIEENTEHEIKAFHKYLENKNSIIHKSSGIEKDHLAYRDIFDTWYDTISNILQTTNSEYKVYLGYQFYLNFRIFEANNLLHLHKEETLLMPTLQELYSDKQLKKLETKAYSMMSSEELIHMMEVLFPYLDANDRYVFLEDMKNTVPDKFIESFIVIINSTKNNTPIISKEEKIYLIDKLNIKLSCMKEQNKYNKTSSKFKYAWENHTKNNKILKTQYKRKQ